MQGSKAAKLADPSFCFSFLLCLRRWKDKGQRKETSVEREVARRRAGATLAGTSSPDRKAPFPVGATCAGRVLAGLVFQKPWHVLGFAQTVHVGKLVRDSKGCILVTKLPFHLFQTLTGFKLLGMRSNASHVC